MDRTYSRRLIITVRGSTIALVVVITDIFSYSSSHCRCTWRLSLASRRTSWSSTRTVSLRFPLLSHFALSRWWASFPCPFSGSLGFMWSSLPEGGRPMNRFAFLLISWLLHYDTDIRIAIKKLWKIILILLYIKTKKSLIELGNNLCFKFYLILPFSFTVIPTITYSTG